MAGGSCCGNGGFRLDCLTLFKDIHSLVAVQRHSYIFFVFLLYTGFSIFGLSRQKINGPIMWPIFANSSSSSSSKKNLAPSTTSFLACSSQVHPFFSEIRTSVCFSFSIFSEDHSSLNRWHPRSKCVNDQVFTLLTIAFI